MNSVFWLAFFLQYEYKNCTQTFYDCNVWTYRYTKKWVFLNCDKTYLTYFFVHFLSAGEIPNSIQYRIFINNWRGNKSTRRTQSLGTVNVWIVQPILFLSKITVKSSIENSEGSFLLNTIFIGWKFKPIYRPVKIFVIF